MTHASLPTALEPMRPTAVLLDLDGTISDSGPVITASIAETLAHFGYPAQTREELLRFVGPPIRDGFRAFAGVPEDQLSAVVADYRARYDERMLQAPVFPGMAELVRELHGRGVPLALATSKRQALAVVVLDDADLSRYFTVIRGASADEKRAAKADVVEDALAGLRERDVDLSRAVMVGDRHHDVDGAGAHGLPTVLVGWGYGRPGEEDGAHAVVHEAAELARLLS
ncbi:phosphoglycolate phosphatase [Georgenia satyanarayanai]|uniref:Phosphoglycolate phosphatase n=1 Tax=Georgenia satyanarayanai TaxID=860221 RepID=A0A2Y9C0H0_9MICO|nr:HAD hydrolase-like protein [Georgenia satyanarayanai]PYF97381.1 phosphoglycolate phosphatase [Georgenia satyanarayanai]SSA46162.1 phosphoglycolate phosphatase [Georgenia satyanarayanai]